MEAFCKGGGIETDVGRNEDKRRRAHFKLYVAYCQGRGELNSVVTPQTVASRDVHRAFGQFRSQLDNLELILQVVSEVSERRFEEVRGQRRRLTA